MIALPNYTEMLKVLGQKTWCIFKCKSSTYILWFYLFIYFNTIGIIIYNDIK